MDKSLTKKQRKKLKMLEKQKQKQQQAHKQKSNSKNSNAHIDKANVNESIRKKSEGNVSAKSKQSNKNRNKEQKKGNNNKKKHHVEPQSNNSQQQLSLDFNQAMQVEENVNVQFLISQINEKQYHSMKMILQKYAKNTSIMSSQWADAIITNKVAGNSVLTQDDDGEEQGDNESEEQQNQNVVDDEQDVCNGVINILPFDNKLSKKLTEKVLKSVENKKNKFNGNKQPSNLLKNNCSVLICERAINLPAFIVKSMHEVLANDLKQLKKSNSTQYSKICGQYILSLSEVQIPKNMKSQQISPEEIIFSRFQDYLFIKNSQCWWIGQVSPNAVKKVPLHKLYFIISTQKYFTTVAEIHTLLNDDQ